MQVVDQLAGRLRYEEAAETHGEGMRPQPVWTGAGRFNSSTSGKLLLTAGKRSLLLRTMGIGDEIESG